MNIHFSDHFTYKKLLRFTWPSIIMMIFTSVYGVVDGYFVSNFVGKTSFAAVNIVWPFIMILGSLGFMFGTGGSALIAKCMGEGDDEKANRTFSLLVYVSLILAACISLISYIFMPKIALMLGAKSGALLEDCILYGRLMIIGLPFFILQMEFQTFFVTASLPKLGLFATVLAGITNMVLDFLFMGVFRWGIAGAAIATGISQAVGGVFPLLYFAKRRAGSRLHLGKTHFDGRALLKTCTNGSSELATNISMSLVSILYNLQLLRYAGENGVAAYGVLMYVNFVFNSAFIGLTVGASPVISYHFGAKNHAEMKSLRQKCLTIIGIFSVMMFSLAQTLAVPLSRVFVGYDAELLALTIRCFRINAFTFCFAGFAIFGSGFFTALNDGLTSATISFLRTLLFQVSAVLLLPLIWELDGIWLSAVVAEVMACVLTVCFLIIKQKKYHY